MEKSSTKINLELANLLIIYKHYKDYLLPVGIIIACVLIIFLVVIPQFQQYFSAQEELKVQVNKLQTLKDNYNFLTNLNDAKVGSDFNTLSLALPASKDFAGIMNAISYASAKTGVPVGDFNFSLGNLSNVSEGVTAYPSIKIDVSLVGNAQEVMKFIDVLYKTAPICEINSMKISGTSGSVTLLFYYKPFPPQKIDDAAPIVVLSVQKLSLVKKISAWNNTVDQSLAPVIPSIFSESESPAATPSSSAGSSGPF